MTHVIGFGFAAWTAHLALAHVWALAALAAFCAAVIAYSVAPWGFRASSVLGAMAMAVAVSASTGGALYLRYRIDVNILRATPEPFVVPGTAVWRAPKPLRLTHA